MDILQPGTKTYLFGKVAHIIECINDDAPQDKAIQGRRYYVDSGGHRWSVTEDFLRENRWG